MDVSKVNRNDPPVQKKGGSDAFAAECVLFFSFLVFGSSTSTLVRILRRRESAAIFIVSQNILIPSCVAIQGIYRLIQLLFS